MQPALSSRFRHFRSLSLANGELQEKSKGALLRHVAMGARCMYVQYLPVPRFPVPLPVIASFLRRPEWVRQHRLTQATSQSEIAAFCAR